MKILSLEIKLYLPWVHSLKEKRMVVKSLLGKLLLHFIEMNTDGEILEIVTEIR